MKFSVLLHFTKSSANPISVTPIWKWEFENGEHPIKGLNKIFFEKLAFKFPFWHKRFQMGQKMYFINCTSCHGSPQKIPFQFANGKLPYSHCRAFWAWSGMNFCGYHHTYQRHDSVGPWSCFQNRAKSLSKQVHFQNHSRHWWDPPRLRGHLGPQDKILICQLQIVPFLHMFLQRSVYLILLGGIYKIGWFKSFLFINDIT